MSRGDSKQAPGTLPRAGDVIDERYRLGDAVASGGMGVIMRAEQLRTGRIVAVKLLHPHIAQKADFAERFDREARVATLFDHSNIVRVYDVGETRQGALYLVMEYLEGEELKDIIAREAPMAAGDVLQLGLQMVDGLAEAHAKQVVHRDIKPANVFVTKTRRGHREAKILDFGVAKLVNAGSTDLTATGVYAGTPSYIAPETMVSTDEKENPTVDVYAAGLVLIEMFTGQKVFDGNGLAQTLIKHLKKPVRIPHRLVGTPVGEVLRVATEKHPADRYADAEEMLQELEQARQKSDPTFRLDPREVPGPLDSTSPSLLQKVVSADFDQGLDILRRAPRHEVYTAGKDPSKKIASDAVTRTVDTVREEDVDDQGDFEVGPTRVYDREGSPDASLDTTTEEFDAAEPTEELDAAEPTEELDAAEPTEELDTADTTPVGLAEETSETIILEDEDVVTLPSSKSEVIGDSEDQQREPGGDQMSSPLWTKAEEAGDTAPLNPALEQIRSALQGGRSTVAMAVLAVVIGSATAAVVVMITTEKSSPPGEVDEDPAVVAADEFEPRDEVDSVPEQGDPQRPEGAEIEAAEFGESGSTGEDRASAALRVSVDTVPSEAFVFGDDAELGQTALEVEFEDDEIPRKLTIEKEGYETETWNLADEYDARDDGAPMKLDLRMRLREEPEPEPEPEPAPRPRPAPSTPSPSPSPAPSPTASEESDSDDERESDGDRDIDRMLEDYLD